MRGAIFMLVLVGGAVMWIGEMRADESRMPLYRQLMRSRGGDPAALAQLVQISRDLSKEDAVQLYETLAEAHLAVHAIDLAADVRRTLATSYPKDPAAVEAMRWLVRTYASSEISLSRRAASGAMAPTKGNPDEGMLTYAIALPAGAPPDAAWQGDPAIAFQQAVATRRLGQLEAAKGLYGATKRTKAPGVWRQCVLCEEWLADRGDEPATRPATTVHRTAERPTLDGRLDEPCWKGEPATLAAADHAEAAAEIRFAYDDKHLYAAISCPRVARVTDAAEDAGKTEHRTRDADLSDQDRVELLVDVDRDFATWFDLTVDSRGWPVDGCMGDSSWNPKWFIATGESTGAGDPRWIVELAIPFSELAAVAPASGDAWVAALTRRTPGRLSASWVGGSRRSPDPANFGLLFFE